jgi:arylsulfatase A
MRTPTIAWWPGKIPAGTTSDAITGMIDVLPTLVTLAGGTLPTDRKLDGANIAPLLFGEPNAKPVRDSFYFYRGLKLEAVRSGSWKLHLEKGELFHLESDIGESNNVAAANSDVVAKLRAIADAMKEDLGIDGIGPGCRPLGKVHNAQPLINHDGQIRAGFEAK